MICPSWCQTDRVDVDPVDGSRAETHSALLAQVGPFSVQLEQLVLDYQADPVTDLTLRHRAEGSDETVSLPADPVVLRQLAGIFVDAAAIHDC